LQQKIADKKVNTKDLIIGSNIKIIIY
jgi:hypothetical protein